MPPKILNYAHPRMRHQKDGEREAFRQYLECKRQGRAFGYAFFFPPGTGKTATTINLIRRIILHEGRFPRILILGPPVVVPNWRDEILKFSKIESKRIVLLNRDTGEKNVKLFESTAFDHMKRKRQAVYVTNYEKLVTSDKLYDLIRQWEPEIIVLDESQRLKNYKASRTKCVEELCNPSTPKKGVRPARPIVIPLSGTPILNNLLDIFPQFLCMDGGESFGDNFFAFRARYFIAKNLRLNSQRTFLKWLPRKNAHRDIAEIVAKKSMSVDFKECIDLPPLIKKEVLLEMGVEQARHYNEMKRQLVTYLNSSACIAQLAIVKALRLMQIASGFIKLDDGQIVVFKDNPKLKYLEEALADIAPNRKVIIWSVFKENYGMIREICSKLKLKMVEIHGECTPTEKREAEKAFQSDVGTRVLSGHPASGGIGINLTAGSYTFYYSSNFSKENRDQSAARDYRKGSERHDSVTHVDLLMRGTIEIDILKKLAEKDAISLSILKALI